jgi:purine-binding chemotaxis protein CheW
MAASETTEILRFDLGDGTYCIDIDHVAEIVSGGDLRSLPGTEPHVEGVMELRGETTTIVNPSELLDSDGSMGNDDTDDVTGDRIIVLDPETVERDTATGWRVSSVSEVTEVTTDGLETDPVADADLLRGLIKEDEGFIFWVEPRELSP